MSVTLGRLRVTVGLLSVVVWLFAALPVAAHAELEATSPRADSTVDTPPQRVAARFSEALGDDSTIELLGPDGSSVASGGIDPENPARLVLAAPAVMEPGEYEVRWAAFGDDGHLERGTFSFTVSAAAATPVPSATAEPTAGATLQPTPEPTDAPLPSPSGPADPVASSGTDVLFPIIALLVVLGGLGLFLLRGRRARGT